jgi:hypothetical protein
MPLLPFRLSKKFVSQEKLRLLKKKTQKLFFYLLLPKIIQQSQNINGKMDER